MFIRSIVIDIVTERCGCAFTEDYISNEQLLCDPSNPLLAVYRAMISSTNIILADDVVTIIEQWISSGATVNTGLFIVMFDSTCPVRISNTSDPICETITVPTTPSVSSQSSGTIIGVVVAVVIAVLLLVAVIIVWLRWAYKKR